MRSLAGGRGCEGRLGAGSRLAVPTGEDGNRKLYDWRRADIVDPFRSRRRFQGTNSPWRYSSNSVVPSLNRHIQRPCSWPSTKGPSHMVPLSSRKLQ